MEKAAKLQQVRFVSAPKERRSSDDIEDGPPSQEDNDGPPSQDDNDVPSSQEGDDVPLFHEDDVVSPLHGGDDHEMVFLGTRFESQDNTKRRNIEERSILSTVSSV